MMKWYISQQQDDLRDSYQSTYRRGHSTKTDLFKVHIDLAEALDEGSMTALIMFDLSIAFDVIDHPELPKCLCNIRKPPLA